jgi:hypothetical protein
LASCRIITECDVDCDVEFFYSAHCQWIFVFSI